MLNDERRTMDVSGITGTAWRKGEVVGEFVLRGGREPAAGGRLVEHVEIRFTDFTSADVVATLEAISRRERLASPLEVDLELADGRRLEDCEIAGFWGGALGERWYGIEIDLDALAGGTDRERRATTT
jgi:hypothetical protein